MRLSYTARRLQPRLSAPIAGRKSRRGCRNWAPELRSSALLADPLIRFAHPSQRWQLKMWGSTNHDPRCASKSAAFNLAHGIGHSRIVDGRTHSLVKGPLEAQCPGRGSLWRAAVSFAPTPLRVRSKNTAGLEYRNARYFPDFTIRPKGSRASRTTFSSPTVTIVIRDAGKYLRAALLTSSAVISLILLL